MHNSSRYRCSRDNDAFLYMVIKFSVAILSKYLTSMNFFQMIGFKIDQAE